MEDLALPPLRYSCVESRIGRRQSAALVAASMVRRNSVELDFQTMSAVACGGRACPKLPGPLPGIAETFLAVGTRLQSAGSWQPSLVTLYACLQCSLVFARQSRTIGPLGIVTTSLTSFRVVDMVTPMAICTGSRLLGRGSIICTRVLFLVLIVYGDSLIFKTQINSPPHKLVNGNNVLLPSVFLEALYAPLLRPRKRLKALVALMLNHRCIFEINDLLETKIAGAVLCRSDACQDDPCSGTGTWQLCQCALTITQSN